MLKFSANISMMFKEEPDLHDRIALAAGAGFKAVEYIFIYDLDVDRLVAETERTGVEWSVVNIAVGEGVKMGPLVAAAPGKRDAFLENLDASFKYCAALKPVSLVVPAYTPPEGVSHAAALPVFKENMLIAADKFAELGVRVIIEPLNPDVRPGSLLTTTEATMDVVRELGHPNLGLEYDQYHMYGMGEDMEAMVEKYLSYIGNIQIADVPGRNEPGTGDVDFDKFLSALDRMGYEHWVALEYEPSGATLDSLGWMKKWL